MKNNRNRTLPHPLLSPYSTDVSPNKFEFDCNEKINITTDRDSFVISGHIRHECPDLDAHVAAGSAVFGLHVECSRTFYRAWFRQDGPEVKVNLPANAVRGRVELLAMCIANRDMPAYSLTGQHADYGGTTFEISTGDLLAVAPEVEFNAYIDLDPIRKISSILDIKRSEDRATGPAQIDFNGDHIEVELVREDYQRYVELRQVPEVRGQLSANVVFPAVLQAVNHLARLSPGELQEAKDNRRWCRCLAARLQQEKTQPDAAPEAVFAAVQQILKDPVRHGISGINDLLQQFTGGGS
jgi:hypothetical protein